MTNYYALTSKVHLFLGKVHFVWDPDDHTHDFILCMLCLICSYNKNNKLE